MDDIVAAISSNIDLQYGIGTIDNIDHLGNRRVRSVGELLQNQLRIDKTYTHFAAFFPVLLILGLFVLGFGSFRSIVDSVDFVDVFFCDFLCLCVCALS